MPRRSARGVDPDQPTRPRFRAWGDRSPSPIPAPAADAAGFDPTRALLVRGRTARDGGGLLARLRVQLPGTQCRPEDVRIDARSVVLWVPPSGHRASPVGTSKSPTRRAASASMAAAYVRTGPKAEWLLWCEKKRKRTFGGTSRTAWCELQRTAKPQAAVGKPMKPDLSNFRTWTHRSPASYMSLHWVTVLFVRLPSRTGGSRFRRRAACRCALIRRWTAPQCVSGAPSRGEVATKKPQHQAKGNRSWPHVILTFTRPKR